MPKKEIIDELTKRKMIRNYFKHFPGWTVWVIVIGIALFVIGAFVPPVIVGGVVFTIIGVLGICSYYRGKPTDQQMDEWLEEDLKVLEKKAIDKFGIDETELVSDPVEVIGVPSGYDVIILLKKWGKDHHYRFTPLNILIINFTQSQLLLYNCIFYFHLPGWHVEKEKTHEYFYKDVVSVSTTEDKFGNKEFTITTFVGTTLSVPLHSAWTLINDHAEKAIQVIRKMIRDKRV